MAPTFFTAESHPVLASRVRAIRPDSVRQWGQLTPDEMLAHLNRTVEMSLGEIEVRDESNFFTRTVLRWLIFHVLPWPKGKVKVPAVFLPKPKGTLEEERGRLLASMERFVEHLRTEPGRTTLHPSFGPLTASYWARVHGKHMDHHLRQFGV